jgi:hypothetical protein
MEGDVYEHSPRDLRTALGCSLRDNFRPKSSADKRTAARRLAESGSGIIARSHSSRRGRGKQVHGRVEEADPRALFWLRSEESGSAGFMDPSLRPLRDPQPASSRKQAEGIRRRIGASPGVGRGCVRRWTVQNRRRFQIVNPRFTMRTYCCATWPAKRMMHTGGRLKSFTRG